MLHFLFGLVNRSRVREQRLKKCNFHRSQDYPQRPLTIPFCMVEWSVQGVLSIMESASTTFLTGNVSLVCLSFLSIMVWDILLVISEDNRYHKRKVLAS